MCTELTAVVNDHLNDTATVRTSLANVSKPKEQPNVNVGTLTEVRKCFSVNKLELNPQINTEVTRFEVPLITSMRRSILQ